MVRWANRAVWKYRYRKNSKMAIKRGSQPGAWLIDAFREMGADVNALLRTLPAETARLVEQPESVTTNYV